MVKDNRYALAKRLIDGGYIRSFREMFDIIPRSVVAREPGMHHTRRYALIYRNTGRFYLKDIIKLPALLEIEEMAMIKMVYEHCKTNNKNG